MINAIGNAGLTIPYMWNIQAQEASDICNSLQYNDEQMRGIRMQKQAYNTSVVSLEEPTQHGTPNWLRFTSCAISFARL